LNVSAVGGIGGLFSVKKEQIITKKRRHSTEQIIIEQTVNSAHRASRHQNIIGHTNIFYFTTEHHQHHIAGILGGLFPLKTKQVWKL